MDLTLRAAVLPLFPRVTDFSATPQTTHENFLPHLLPSTRHGQSFYDSHSGKCSGYIGRVETMDLSWVGGGRAMLEKGVR